MAKRQTCISLQRDRHTHFITKRHPLFFYCKETDKTILLHKRNARTHFVAKRQTKLFYYTDTNAYILWQRDRQNHFSFLLHRQTHTFCSKRDETVSPHRCKHIFIAAKRRTHFLGLKDPWELGKMDKVQENKCTTHLNREHSGLLRHTFWAGLSP